MINESLITISECHGIYQGTQVGWVLFVTLVIAVMVLFIIIIFNYDVKGKR